MTTTERKAAGHTPGPWRYHRVNSYFSITNDPSSFSGKWCGCIALTPERECDTAKEQAAWEKQDEANAQFVCRAVNSHDDLLAALEAIVNDSPPRLSIRLVNLEKARAAIAKAKAQ